MQQSKSSSHYENKQILPQPIEEEFKFENNPLGQVYYYKVVAKTLGKLYSIYDGKTEYILGKEMHEKALKNHQGGYYVYSSIDQAIFADVPFKKGGLYFAPRTIIKCACWGDKIEYGNGKIAYTNLLPVSDLGMPKGYIATKAGKRDAQKKYQELELQKKGLKPKLEWKKTFTSDKEKIYKQPMQAYTISLRDEQEYKKQDKKSKILQHPIIFDQFN